MNRSSLPLRLCPALQEFVLSEVHLVQIKLQRKSCQMLSVSIAIHIPRWEKPTSPPDNRVMVKMTEIMVTMTIHSTHTMLMMMPQASAAAGAGSPHKADVTLERLWVARCSSSSSRSPRICDLFCSTPPASNPPTICALSCCFR